MAENHSSQNHSNHNHNGESRSGQKKKEKRVSVEVDNVGDLAELDMELLKIARKKSVGKEMMEFSMKIPKSLRSVAPFLEEAQSLFSSSHLDNSMRRVAICCIDHALYLVSSVDVTLDSDAQACLDKFSEFRSKMIETLEAQNAMSNLQSPLSRECSGNFSASSSLPLIGEKSGASTRQEEILSRPSSSSSKNISSHNGASTARRKSKTTPEQVLVMEANSTMNLADFQYAEGHRREAARNYHTATVYFRVLESIVPNQTLSKELHQKLQYCAVRTRECSHLLQSFVPEHFEGKKCSDVYNIFTENRIGKGSYGSVYYCRHKKTQEEYACKVINVNRINSHYLRKLHLEVDIMKDVDHPNIIKLRGVFFGQRTVCMVMELCKGGELFDHLTGNKSKKKGFEEPRAAKLTEEMLSAISYLHSQGIVHRDLKLENFLFDQKGPNASLKLIDFGLSKHFVEHEKMHQVVGSAYYTAPEVLEGGYGKGCDVWSIGVISYMLLSGCPPFYGSNSEAIHQMILNNEPDYSAKRFAHVSIQAIDFLKRLLVKDPMKRISTAEALDHPFIQRHNAPNTKDSIHSDVYDSLASFVHLSQHKRLTLEVVAYSLNFSEMHLLRDDFLKIDKDKSGTVSLGELKHSFERMNREIPPNVLDIFHSVDVDQSQEINYNEFIAAAMCRRISIDEEKLVLAFEAMDTDCTGYLTREAIEQGVGQMMTHEEMDEMMEEIDTNKDGKIDYQEFLVFWRKLYVDTRLAPTEAMKVPMRKNSTSSLHTIRTMRPMIRSASLSPRSLDHANQKSLAPLSTEPLPKLREKRHSIELGTHVSKSDDSHSPCQSSDTPEKRIDKKRVLPKIGDDAQRHATNKVPFFGSPAKSEN